MYIRNLYHNSITYVNDIVTKQDTAVSITPIEEKFQIKSFGIKISSNLSESLVFEEKS